MKKRKSKIRKSYKGLQKNIRDLKTPSIETWKNQYPDKTYTITLDVLEFTCVCPKTGLPDFAKLHITYIPNKQCVELKSLKEYCFFFRNIGIFHEHVANKILEDFVAACSPRFASIAGEFNIRGGIKTHVFAEYIPKDSEPPFVPGID